MQSTANRLVASDSVSALGNLKLSLLFSQSAADHWNQKWMHLCGHRHVQRLAAFFYLCTGL